jgi:hypothetical protein
VYEISALEEDYNHEYVYFIDILGNIIIYSFYLVRKNLENISNSLRK